MAKINGIELKNVRFFKDHEGATIAQGDIHYYGKKLGFWSQDSWGGPDRYDFDTKILDEAVADYVKSNRVKDEYKEFADLDCLLYDLINLRETEKRAKIAFKDKYKTYVEATDGHQILGYKTNDSKDTVKDTERYKDFMEKCKMLFYEEAEIKTEIYEGLADFDITAKAEDEREEEIER